MSYTLLGLVDQVCGEMGLAQPTVVIGTGVNQTLQMLALAQRLGKDLIREFEWQRLVKAYIFTTSAATTTTGTLTANSPIITAIPTTVGLVVGNVVTGGGVAPYAQILTIDSATQVTLDTPATTAGTAVALTFAVQDYAVPAGFDRMVSDTNWDRTNHWRNLGAKSSQEWQWLQGGVISIGPRERYRIYDGKLRIFAAITTGYNFAYEYVSKYWVVATGETSGTKEAFTADTDTCVFEDDLMLAGLKYYFLKAKKLDFGVEMADYNDILSTRKAQDVPIAAQSLAPIQLPELVGPWSVQDGNWPTS